MPGKPDLTKSEGFIRTHHLFQELDADVAEAYRLLEEKRESQYLRRCVVRTIYSYIEAVIEIIKHEIRATLRKSKIEIQLSKAEQELIGSIYSIGQERGKVINLVQNTKRTFKLAKKVWDLEDYNFNTDGQEFESFLESKDARNRLTHPKIFYDIQVTKEDMHHHSVTYDWVHNEFLKLIQSRLQSIAKDLPKEIADQLLNNKSNA
ncbi:MAG: hypothetical protein OCC45_02510 [Desulfotalea sp.]